MSQHQTTVPFPFVARRLAPVLALLPFLIFLNFYFPLLASQTTRFHLIALWYPFNSALLLFFYIPLVLHFFMTFVRLFEGKSNVFSFPYASNWQYTLGRFSNLLALLFLISLFINDIGQPLIYFIGVTAILYAVLTAFWQILLTFGICIEPRLQKRSLWILGICFAFLTFIHLGLYFKNNLL